ncbi:DoxX family protein [Erythrobacter litoralis]|uniref:Putative membrane protein n=1 Tax=Erythrobacter litoralis (strain HTCC2594) TaxID=314225 RepID=Q2N7E9_ERYLH|nr:DoxX family protein [Erythrobacter litoralis]ABC64392.1 putative membrane protein [Erythrobacter litoralis HTCC2594]
MAMIASIAGRLMLALLFILAGLNKIMNPADTAAYIEAQTALPPSLALPTGIFELVAGLFLAAGFMTRLSAFVLAVFTLLTIPLFHAQVSDPTQMTMALKNLAIAGGLLIVVAYGQARGSVDKWRERDRARKAEIKAAHAEGRAKGAETAATARHD